MKTCFVWSLYNDVMIKDEISNLVWIRLSVNSDLKILMNSSKYNHLELLLLKLLFFMEKLDFTEEQPSALDYQQILVVSEGYKNLS